MQKDNFFALALLGECASSSLRHLAIKLASSPSHDNAFWPNRYLFLPLFDVDTMMAFGRVQLRASSKVVRIYEKQTISRKHLTKVYFDPAASPAT